MEFGKILKSEFQNVDRANFTNLSFWPKVLIIFVFQTDGGYVGYHNFSDYVLAFTYLINNQSLVSDKFFR